MAAALLAGAFLRVLTLPLPGTEDVNTLKTWTYHAVTGGVTRIYGVDNPFERRVLAFTGQPSKPDYPPLAMYELAAIGHVYSRLSGGQFPDTAFLTIVFRTPIILMDAALLLILAYGARLGGGPDAGAWTAIAYWLNPAVLLSTALGYVDVYYLVPILAALMAAVRGRPMLAGALTAAAVMTKPQALFIAPAIALAIWNNSGAAASRRHVLRAAGVALLVGAVLAAPVLLAGGGANMAVAVASLAHDDTVSGNGANVWWMAGHAARVLSARATIGFAQALTTRAELVFISDAVARGYPNPRVIGALLAAGVMAWALWTARRARSIGLAAALGAFLLHAYTMLSAQVHENHLVGAVPLLVLAGRSDARLRPACAAVSAIVAANMYLFYGVTGDGPAPLARTLTGLDTTVVLSAINVVVLVWFAKALARASRDVG